MCYRVIYSFPPFFFSYYLVQMTSKTYIWVNCARIVRFAVKNRKKIKVNTKKIGVVHSIEPHLLYINRVFSQLSCFSFRKKSSLKKKACFSRFLDTVNNEHKQNFILTSKCIYILRA